MNIELGPRAPDPFAQVDKKFLSNPQLSWKAKGIVSYLVGQPESWTVQIKDVINKSTDGRDAIYSAMKELRGQGYAKYVVVKKNGRIVRHKWIVSDFPLPDFPDLENPDLNKNKGNPSFIYKYKKKSRRTSAAALDSFQLNGYSHHLSEIETKFSPVVIEFARFSKEKGYHIRGKNLKRVIYAKGGCAGGWTRQTLSTWQSCYRGLLHQAKDKNKIKEVLEWFIANHEVDEWCPECYAFTTFCERFGRIEKAMRRSQAKVKRQMNLEDDGEAHSHIIHYVRGKDGKRRLVQDDED